MLRVFFLFFLFFFCEELNKSVSQKLRGLYRWEDLGWKSV